MWALLVWSQVLLHEHGTPMEKVQRRPLDRSGGISAVLDE
jgi:hypothetical protein